MKTSVSVVMIIRNVEKYIANCILSILDQTYDNFEIVVIDDLSSDYTKKIIDEFDDKRIRYVRNEKWLGISKSRNRGVKYAVGRYIFFTDGDCMVSQNWIEEGLKCLKDPDCVGVEGKIYYVSEDYEPTFSDHVMENRYGGRFMTGNMAYKKRVIETVGGFDEKLTYFEDRDIALRAIKHGKICFNPKMIAYHPRVILTPKRFIESAANVRNLVRFFRKFGMHAKFGERGFLFWHILLPINLVKILFPPLIFSSLFFKRFKNSDDFKLLPFMYIYVICERLQLWEECAREGVFLI
jgi:glycosyltransferase involved in cell wall biosynthesis